MNERIKRVRKEKRLTQQEFAERIGVSRGAIAQFELGNNGVSNSVIRSICREFRVNETWLRTGDGEMFLPEPKNEVDELLARHGLPPDQRSAVECFLRLPDEDRAALMRFLYSFVDSLPAADPDAARSAQLHSDLDAQLEAQKNPPEGSEESSSTSSSMG